MGNRVPGASQSQRDFRAAVIRLIDENHPATRSQLDALTAYIEVYSFPGVSVGAGVFVRTMAVGV